MQRAAAALADVHKYKIVLIQGDVPLSRQCEIR